MGQNGQLPVGEKSDSELTRGSKLLVMSASELAGRAPFRTRFPWWGGDLQTVRNYLAPPTTELPSLSRRQFAIALDDGSGDRLVATLDEPDEAKRPTILIIHGLTGCEGSYYVLNSARFWLQRGHRVVRLNLRGAGPSAAFCSKQYHAGASADLASTLRAIADQNDSADVVAIGYSLGGNILLKYLGETANDVPLAAAVSISAPIDLAATSERFMRPRNALYARWLLARMKQEAVSPARSLTPDERDAVGLRVRRDLCGAGQRLCRR